MAEGFGIVHYNTPGATVEEFLHFVAGAGFVSVELQVGDIWPNEACCGEERTAQVKEVLDRLGLGVSAVASGNDFVVLEEEAVKAQVDRMEAICKLAKMLDCDTIRTEGGQPKESVPQEKWVEAMAGCLKRCLEWAEPMGMKFAVDNHGYVTNEWPIQLELFEAVGSPLVGANFDTMNYRWFGHSIEKLHEIYEQIAPFVLHTHLKDGFGSRAEYQGQALGEGEIPLAWAIECLKKAGYTGAWTLEYEKSSEHVAGIRRSLCWMKNSI